MGLGFRMCENIFACQIKFALFPLWHINLLKYASYHQYLLTELCLSSLTSLNLFLYKNIHHGPLRWLPSRKNTLKSDLISNNPDSGVDSSRSPPSVLPGENIWAHGQSRILFWLFFIARNKQSPRFFPRTSHKLVKYPICCSNPIFLPLSLW